MGFGSERQIQLGYLCACVCGGGAGWTCACVRVCVSIGCAVLRSSGKQHYEITTKASNGLTYLVCIGGIIEYSNRGGPGLLPLPCEARHKVCAALRLQCALTESVLYRRASHKGSHGMACVWHVLHAWGPLWCLRVSCVLHVCVAEVPTQGYMHMHMCMCICMCMCMCMWTHVERSLCCVLLHAGPELACGYPQSFPLAYNRVRRVLYTTALHRSPIAQELTAVWRGAREAL